MTQILIAHLFDILILSGGPCLRVFGKTAGHEIHKFLPLPFRGNRPKLLLDLPLQFPKPLFIDDLAFLLNKRRIIVRQSHLLPRSHVQPPLELSLLSVVLGYLPVFLFMLDYLLEALSQAVLVLLLLLVEGLHVVVLLLLEALLICYEQRFLFHVLAQKQLELLSLFILMLSALVSLFLFGCQSLLSLFSGLLPLFLFIRFYRLKLLVFLVIYPQRALNQALLAFILTSLHPSQKVFHLPELLWALIKLVFIVMNCREALLHVFQPLADLMTVIPNRCKGPTANLHPSKQHPRSNLLLSPLNTFPGHFPMLL